MAREERVFIGYLGESIGKMDKVAVAVYRTVAYRETDSGVDV
jgi:hypothetical protein